MITPILMAGGLGTRLWPASRKSFPKQFACLADEKDSLFQQTLKRFSGKLFAPPLVVTNEDYRFTVKQQMNQINVKPEAIIIEPERKNTAPAILLAALHLKTKNPDFVAVATPTDHFMPDIPAFHKAVEQGLKMARSGNLLTFGILPDGVESGYGHMEVDFQKGESNIAAIRRFVEKPDFDTAASMTDSGKYLWNAGIFMFSAETIIKAFSDHAPYLIEPVTKSVNGSKTDLGFVRPDRHEWEKTPDISIDYAVMEKASNLMAVKLSQKWSDLGDWRAIWKESKKSESGNSETGSSTYIDCQDSLLKTYAPNTEILGIGLKNIAAVATSDAVLICDLNRAQEVRSAVDALAKKNASQASDFPKDHRPWGWFETLTFGPSFKVKKILVYPGASLSLQSHKFRSEHWVVVKGVARVTLDDRVMDMSENESIYIPVGSKHRLENPKTEDLEIIEVQTGSYFGEDDIVRYSDVYQRMESS